MNITIDVGKDFKRVTQSLNDFAQKQLPFAIAQSLNELGGMVKAAEQAEIKKQFPSATPFTIKSVGQSKARKGETETTIYVKDIAAAYLLPYLEGGKHHLNSRALLNPKNIALNAYGNLPRGKINSLKGRPNIFIGPVKGKNGDTINGVWQRITATSARPARGAKGARKARAAQPAVKAHLKLLVRFGDALPVKQRLDWEQTARTVVAANFERVFGRQMARAIATAKLK